MTKESDNKSSAVGTVSREDVKDFYGKAGDQPQPGLCCPTAYESEEISHIPKEVLDISYGCGSPVTLANLKKGEIHVDLGSGGGVDCFIAARYVGKEGRVIGVDMTPEMMQKATKNSDKVAAHLGYKNVEFRHGFLENVPVKEGEADLVTSNCVVNLAPDKSKVFDEIHRILKSGGRYVISDVVSEGEIPDQMKKDKNLWGECISGALTEKEFLELPAKAGFYGLGILKRTFYREVEGLNFWSVTVQGWKMNKGKECVYVGQTATYLGPFSEIKDDEDHTYLRGTPLEICTDTAAKLSKAPYKGSFLLTDPTKQDQASPTCEPTPSGSSCC